MLTIQSADNVERAPNSPFALVSAQAAQRWCRPAPAQCPDFAANGPPSGERIRDGNGLIEATLPQPPAVERHRYEYGTIWQTVRQNRRDHPRKPGPARIFQTQYDAFGNVTISDCGDHGIVIGPLPKAACASRVIGNVERTRTMRATGSGQKHKLSPASRAEAVIVLDNRSAAGAPRRQHEIEDGTEETHRLVVDPVSHRHKDEMASASGNVPQLFDRSARMLRRARANGAGFFGKMLSSDLLDRLDSVNRTFSHALLIGDLPLIAEGLRARGIASSRYEGDEDQLGGRDAEHDLVLSSGTLDTVCDLPGALILMRRALKPDGLLLANFAAAPSLDGMRAAVAIADDKEGRAVARFHPQIDVRSAGDLLMRAGFALPVADVTTSNVAYSSFAQLLADLREGAATNLLVQRYPVSRRWVAAATAAFEGRGGPDKRTLETLSFVTLTAWAPAPSQPQPAKRGSGSTSLAEALRRRGN